MIRLALGTLRHRTGRHAAVLAVVVGGAAVSSSILTVLLAAEGPGLAHLAAADRARAAAFSAEMTLPMLALSQMITAFTSVFVIASAVGFALDARRRELGLLRLLGASPLQVATLGVAEATALGVLGGAVGAALGVPGAHALRAALVSADLADPALRSPGSWAAALATVGIATVTAAAGACGPARRAGRLPPAAALALPGGARRAMTPGRWVLVVVATIGGAATLLVTEAADDDVLLMLALLTSWVAVVGLTALAPVVVPAAARVVAAPARLVAPAAALLAGADARLHARRTAALATPLGRVVGLYAGMGTLSATARALPGPAPDDPVPAALVVGGATAGSGPGAQSAGTPTARLQRACAEVPGVAVCAPVAPLPGAWEAGGVPGTGGLVVDPATAGIAGVRAVRGDLSELGGAGGPGGAGQPGGVGGPGGASEPGHARPATEVAAVGARVEHDGEIRYTDPSGGVHDLRAGAVVAEDGPLRPGWAPVLSFAQLAAWGDPSPQGVELWVAVDPGARADDVAGRLAAALGGDVRSVAEWRADRDAAEQAQNHAGLLALFGAAEALALTAVAVTCASSARDRRGQTALLRRTGAAGRQVLGAALLEVALVTAVAAVLVAAVQGALVGRISMLLPGVPVVTPWRDLAVLLGAGVVLAALTTGAATAREVRRAGRAG